jgi:hypothetical protein
VHHDAHDAAGDIHAATVVIQHLVLGYPEAGVEGAGSARHLLGTLVREDSGVDAAQVEPWAEMNGNPNWYSIEHEDFGTLGVIKLAGAVMMSLTASAAKVPATAVDL